MTHKLACAFQQTLRIGNFGTSKEPDIHVSFEGVDVPECRVSYARRRMAIMQQFSHIVSTLTHNLKPMLRDYAQFPVCAFIQVSMAGSRLTEPENRRS